MIYSGGYKTFARLELHYKVPSDHADLTQEADRYAFFFDGLDRDLSFNVVTFNGAKLRSHGACGVPAHETPFIVEMSFDNMGVSPDNASLIVVIFQAHGTVGAQDFAMTPD